MISLAHSDPFEFIADLYDEWYARTKVARIAAKNKGDREQRLSQALGDSKCPEEVSCSVSAVTDAMSSSHYPT